MAKKKEAKKANVVPADPAAVLYGILSSDEKSASFGITMSTVRRIIERHGTKKFAKLITSDSPRVYIRSDRDGLFTSAVLLAKDDTWVGNSKRNRYGRSADAPQPTRGATIALSRMVIEAGGKKNAEPVE